MPQPNMFKSPQRKLGGVTWRDVEWRARFRCTPPLTRGALEIAMNNIQKIAPAPDVYEPLALAGGCHLARC